MNKHRTTPSKLPLSEPTIIMKTIATTLAALTLVILGSTQQADAHGYQSRIYISSYLPCGTPVYTERYFIGHDRWGNPVWGTRIVRHRHVVRPVYVAPYPPRHVTPRRCDVPRHGVNVGFGVSYSR